MSQGFSGDLLSYVEPWAEGDPRGGVRRAPFTAVHRRVRAAGPRCRCRGHSARKPTCGGPNGDADVEVTNPRAYLCQITTRLSLNRLRTLSRRREDYVGPWLPEPLLTVPDVADDVVLAESVSLALMVVLESLGPKERAVFLLREVFGYERTPRSPRRWG